VAGGGGVARHRRAHDSGSQESDHLPDATRGCYS
jgi:hypothetical protein